VGGSDSDFPFGPFRMYATRDDPNGVVRVLHVQVVTATGRVVDVTNAADAPRRSELEGRVSQIVADPHQLSALAPIYARDVPDARAVQLVWRDFALHDGRREQTTDQLVLRVPVAEASR
jgi:hypothetical protein